MILLGSIRDFTEDINKQVDEVWVVTRGKMTLKSRGRQVVVKELAPSGDLLRKYIWLREQGMWNDETFRSDYVPKYLEEMLTEEARLKLNELYSVSKDKVIYIVCFCHDESLCHRSILGGLMQGVGVEVESVSGGKIDYSKYSDEYTSMLDLKKKERRNKEDE